MTLKRLLLNTLRSSRNGHSLSPAGSLLVCLLAIPTTGIAFGESASSAEMAPAADRNVVALEGSVRSEKGEPLVGALVSIFGAKLGSAGVIAFTDEKGRFLIAGLEPGYYTLRAYLSGFLPSRHAGIELDNVASSKPVSVQMVSFREKESPALPLLQPTQEIPRPPAATDTVQDDDGTAEFEWLLRHAKRNILHEDAASLPAAPEKSDGLNEAMAEQAVAFEPTGELGLFGFERGLHDIPTSPGELDAQLAYARLNIPTGEASEWIVSAQLLESALSSWAASGEFVSERSPGRRVSAGFSYGNYVYGDVNESPRLTASTSSAPDRPTNEWFGTAYGGQSFQVGVANVGAGLAYHHYSYLDRKDYAAPRLDVAVVLDDATDTLLRGLFDYRVLAPGGEDLGLLARMVSADFMGSADLGPRDLTAETTIRYQLSVERSFGDRGAVEFRVFQEDVRDPLLKAYLEKPAGAVGIDGPGHYLVTNQGDLRARGVGMVVAQDFGDVSGSVGYRFGVAHALAEDVGAFETGQHYGIHDLTTSVRTEIDPTRTRVLAVCRLSVHPSLAPSLAGLEGVPNASTAGLDSTSTSDLDARFNLQVHQLLPFIGWNSTEWEFVFAVRNLFYEDWEAVSLIDEMSVVDSPARVMGGVKVQF